MTIFGTNTPAAPRPPTTMLLASLDWQFIWDHIPDFWEGLKATLKVEPLQGDEVEIRNASGAVTVIPKTEIDERGKTEISVMPTGLADPLTPRELASIMAYLESLRDSNSK